MNEKFSGNVPLERQNGPASSQADADRALLAAENARREAIQQAMVREIERRRAENPRKAWRDGDDPLEKRYPHLFGTREGERAYDRFYATHPEEI